MFESEEEMSLRFEKFLSSNFGGTYLKEQSGLFGIPDFVFYAKNENDFSFISFELKLRNWKRAAKQAFRHKCFSNVSYVVLDFQYATPALEKIDFFRRYNIGLATFGEEGCFQIHYRPQTHEPYSEELKLKLIKTVAKSKKRTKTIKPLLDLGNFYCNPSSSPVTHQ
jgi:hypothetical protein